VLVFLRVYTSGGVKIQTKPSIVGKWIKVKVYAVYPYPFSVEVNEHLVVVGSSFPPLFAWLNHHKRA